MYADGAATAAAAAAGAPRDGDIQLSKVAAGRRLKPEITTNTSKFQLVGYDSDIVEQDKATIGAGFTDTAEATNQLNLATNLKHWLCRPKPLKNRANGTDYTLTGTAPQAIAGPDGRSFALLFFTGSSRYTQADTTVYSDFAISFWVKGSLTDINARIFVITGTLNFFVEFDSYTVLNVNGDGTVTITTIATGWHNFWLVRSGSTVSVYQNGSLIGTVTTATARGGTQMQINPDLLDVTIDDLRIYNATKSAADIAYYYADVVNNAGKIVLPLA
jgi:hypothetical protein